MRLVRFAAMVGLLVALAGPAVADTVLPEDCYLYDNAGTGELRKMSDNSAFLTASSGSGTKAAPFVFNLGDDNLDLNGYNIHGAKDHTTLDQYSAKWIVTDTGATGLVGHIKNTGTGGDGSFYSYGDPASDGEWGGDVIIEAANSVAVKNIRTDAGYWPTTAELRSGDINVLASNGTLTVTGYLSTQTEGPAWKGFYSGDISLKSYDGGGGSAGVTVSGSAGGYSIRTGGISYGSKYAGDVVIESDGAISLANSLNLDGSADGWLSAKTTAGSGMSITLDDVDCSRVESVRFDSDTGASSIVGDLTNFSSANPKLWAPTGDSVSYDAFRSANAYLSFGTYTLKKLDGTDGGGILTPAGTPHVWTGDTTAVWDGNQFDDAGADPPTAAREVGTFGAGATSYTVTVNNTGGNPVVGAMRFEGGTAYTLAAGTGTITVDSNAASDPGYIIVAGTAAHAINAPMSLASDLRVDVMDAGGNLTVSGGITTGTGDTVTKVGPGTVTIGAANVLPSGGNVTVAEGTLDLGANSQAGVANVTLDGGTIAATGAVNLGSTPVTLNSGTLSGAGSLTTTGNYTAASGTVHLNTTIGGSVLTVSGSGVLKGAGNASGGLTVTGGGTVAPGSSVGTLSAGNTTLASGGNYNVEMEDAAAGAGVGYDTLAVTGTLDVAATTAAPHKVWLQTVTAGGSFPTNPGNAANFNKDAPATWTIASTTGGVTNFTDPDQIRVSPKYFTNEYDGNWMVGFSARTDGTNLYVDYTPQKLREILVDFSDSRHPGNPVGGPKTWNTVDDRTTAFPQMSLVTSDGQATEIKLDIIDSFSGSGNVSGWSGAGVPSWYESNAFADWFSVSHNENGIIKLSGLDPKLKYYFELVASAEARSGQEWYACDYLVKVGGAVSYSQADYEFSIGGVSDQWRRHYEGYLYHDLMLWEIEPDADGVVYLWVDNNYYGGGINALRITAETASPIPEPAGLSLIGLALLGLRKKRS